MISIRKFLSQTDAEQARIHAVRVLVSGIRQHVVEGDADECSRFRNSMQRIADALTDDISSEDLLIQAGSVLKGLEDYTRSTTRQLRMQSVELQNMLKMLTSAIGALSTVSKVNVGRLNDIEKQVGSASELDDVRMIKGRLSDCLNDIREETERQRKEAAETIEQLSQRLEEARQRSTDR